MIKVDKMDDYKKENIFRAVYIKDKRTDFDKGSIIRPFDNVCPYFFN